MLYVYFLFMYIFSGETGSSGGFGQTGSTGWTGNPGGDGAPGPPGPFGPRGPSGEPGVAGVTGGKGTICLIIICFLWQREKAELIQGFIHVDFICKIYIIIHNTKTNIK